MLAAAAVKFLPVNPAANADGQRRGRIGTVFKTLLNQFIYLCKSFQCVSSWLILYFRLKKSVSMMIAYEKEIVKEGEKVGLWEMCTFFLCDPLKNILK